MPDPNDGFYPTDPEDPEVRLSLDGRTRYSDLCACGAVADLQKLWGEWMCSACRDERHAQDDEDDLAFSESGTGPTMEDLGEWDVEDTWDQEGYY